MKRLLLTTMLTVMLMSVRVDAAMITVDYNGETYVTSNNIERSLIVNSDDATYYNIAVRPLEETITNTAGTVSIPLEYFFLNNTREDVYLKYNEYSNVYHGVEMDGVPRVINAKIKEYGIVPAGTYSILLEVQATDIETQDVVATTSFNLQFVVPIVHELNTYGETPKISVSAADVFKKSTKIANKTSPMIYIRSNTDWILTLDPKNLEETQGKIYVRTTSGSGKVTSRLQEQAFVNPGGSEIILARGIAPAENEYVSVEFSIENPETGVIPAGEYVKKIKYIRCTFKF